MLWTGKQVQDVSAGCVLSIDWWQALLLQAFVSLGQVLGHLSLAILALEGQKLDAWEFERVGSVAFTDKLNSEASSGAVELLSDVWFQHLLAPNNV